MKNKHELSLIPALQSRISILMSIVFDSLFIIIWAAINHALGYALLHVDLGSSIDNLSLKIFQWLFGFATLIPVTSYTIIDVWSVIIRTYITVVRVWEDRYEYRKGL